MPLEKESQTSKDKLTGRYSNYFKVGFNKHEFLIDFGQLYSESMSAVFHTRIVTLPVYAKSLVDTLLKTLERYEQTHGIQDDSF